MARFYAHDCRVNSDGTIPDLDRETWNIMLEQFRGRKITIEIRDRMPSINQRWLSFFHAVWLPMIMEALRDDKGWEVNPSKKDDQDRVKLMLLYEFWSDEPSVSWSEKFKSMTVDKPSLKDIPQIDSEQFIEPVRRWAKEELDLTLPEPDPDWKTNSISKQRFSPR